MKTLMQIEKSKEMFYKYQNNIDENANSLSDENGFYRFIIHYLTNLEFSEEEARYHYDKIVQHKEAVSEKLNRDIGLRVATMDYFHNIEQEFYDPKIIENDLFEKLLTQSKIDPKTGCYHLNAFKETVQIEIHRAERYNHSLSIVMIDIDDFKKINAKFGHEEADRLLKRFAKTIRENLRGEDVLARYGGDEFVLLLPHTGRIGARMMAERVRNALLEHFKTDNGVLLTFSGGISTFPHDAKACDVLIEKADRALYRSKNLGKNRIYDYLEENFLKESEKRREPRFSLNTPFPIKLSNSNDLLLVDGKIINVSASGILIECICEINENLLKKQIHLKIERFLKKQYSPFQIIGKVIRFNKNQRNYKFHIAMEFENPFKNVLLQKLENEIFKAPEDFVLKPQ